jgi:orotate phosphoribosyltransferase
MLAPFSKEAVRLGLLKIAPTEEGFVTRSGNRKAYVIDSRGAGTNLPLRRFLVDLLVPRLELFPHVDVVAGVAKSGIVWASWVAWQTRLGYATVLIDGRRQSGMQRDVEGEISGKNVVLVDNWTRSGESLQHAAHVAENAGAQVLGAITIARHGMADLRMPTTSLWQAEELEMAAMSLGLLPMSSINLQETGDVL